MREDSRPSRRAAGHRPLADLLAILPLLAVALSSSGCTYGPPEERHRVRSVFRIPDTHRVLLAVGHDRYRPPTGINRFPNGGVPRYLGKRVTVYSGDAQVPRLTTLDTVAVPRSVWQGLGVDLVAWDGRHAYLQLHGCSAGRDSCYERSGDSIYSVQRGIYFRVRPDARPERVDSVPEGAGLPGYSAAPMAGEQNYTRIRIARRGVEARTEEEGPYQLVYRLRDDGSLEAVGASATGTAGPSVDR